MKKLLFSLLILSSSFIFPRNPFNLSKKEVKRSLIQSGFELKGIAEYNGQFGAVISVGTSSSIVFVGDNFHNYQISCIGKDHIVLDSSNENKKLNLVLKS